MSADAAPSLDLVTLRWVVPNEHSHTFTHEEWVEFVRSVDRDLDPDDIDEIFNFFEDARNDGPEALVDLATDRNWVDNDPSRVEIRDLFRVTP